MPMADAMELFDYWKIYPPVHVLMRMQSGYKPEANAVRTLPSPSSRPAATKLALAAPRDRAIFEELRAMRG